MNNQAEQTRLCLAYHFKDAISGTAVGSGGTILRTNDGGTTWVAQSSGITGDLYSVSFSDPMNGTIVGDAAQDDFLRGVILRTSDGGNTWIQQPIRATNVLYGVSFIDANNGTAVGLRGTILHTTMVGTPGSCNQE